MGQAGDDGDHSIKPPKNEADVERFLLEVESHADYVEVEERLSAFGTDPQRLMFWSVEQYRSASGRWSVGRRKLHRDIVRRVLETGNVAGAGERPQAVILIGPPGAGKTKAGVPLAKAMGVQFTVINADDVKELLPEYEGWNAALVHEESSWLAEEMIYFLALMQRRHVLLDLTGTNQEKIGQMAVDMSADNYDVHIIFVDLPAWQSVGRAWTRFQTNPLNRLPGVVFGRFVPPRYVYNVVDGKPALTYEYLKGLQAVKSWRRISTDVPPDAPPILLEHGSR